MLIIVSKHLIPRGYSGLAIFPFIIFSKSIYKNDDTYINHEKIHIRQQLEMLIIPFFIWYFLEFFYRLFQYKKTALAYQNISFEREAYSNEQNSTYLRKRKFWSFLKYLN